MIRVLRAIGVAILITATLHATAGICLCHRGPDAQAPAPGGHACCHGPDTGGPLALRTVPTCCHIEAAQRDMTPTDAVHLAPPADAVRPTVMTASDGIVMASAAPTFAPSPPIRVLRV